MKRREATASIILAALAVAGTSRLVGDEPEARAPIAEKITVKQPEIGDVETVLRIQKRSGEFLLTSIVESASLVIDVYKDGRKTDSFVCASFISATPSRGFREGRFVVQAVDLDYLPLGDGKKQHTRIRADLSLNPPQGAGFGSTRDLPKTTFDFSQVRLSGEFTAFASTVAEVPLFWMAVRGRGFPEPATVKGLVWANETYGGDLLIAYLRLNSDRGTVRVPLRIEVGPR